MKLPLKSKPPPLPDPAKDRLTVSLWGLKVEGVGQGVTTALIVVFVFGGLWTLNTLIGLIR